MSGLEHVDDYPEIPVSLASTSTILKTGAWRSVRPIFANRMAPCSAGCPAGVGIPAYIDDIRQGKLEAAYAAVTARNPFPRITGRVCPHMCEDRCNLAITTGEESVSIRSIERWLGDAASDLPDPVPEEGTGKRIGVVGSGPAGMAAAYYLRRTGHEVAVFDRRPQPGGILRYGIPEYRLPSDVVDSEIDRLKDMGVEFHNDVALGTDFTLDDLEAAYAAVFVATGAWKENPIGIEGESLLEPGLDFLEAANRGTADLPGPRCAVVGGGNVAMDVARMLRRLGADVSVLYRRTANEMPAIKEEYEHAVADGVHFHWLVMPRAVEKDGERLRVTIEEMWLGEPDGSGRLRPEPTGVTCEMHFDGVFSAIGESADTSVFPARLTNEAGWLDLGESGETVDEMVFAGGDLATGPATVIEAIVAGRRAARAIDEQLGFGGAWPPEEPLEVVPPKDVNLTYMPHHERSDDHSTATLVPFAEETETLSEAEILEEIDRCLSCGYCNSCGTCFVFCPDGAIIWDDGPRVDHEFCKGCGICVAECPGHVMVLVNEREVSNA
jgi:NADPH-dependent glutamate synthase beta subunit-like oxidoreductase/Pyruvate/2-oxoacid:ferredoxin oxidoreductase delta subunit